LLIVVASLAGACTDGDASPDRTPETAISPPETPSPSASPAPATEPDARGYALMTDVPGDLGVVVFGGFDGPECCELADMWSYRPGRDWTELTPDSLPGIGFEFAFDAASDRLVLAEPEGETWAYDPAANTWEAKTEVGPPVWGSAMTYDAQSDRMILVGEDQTWAYDLDRDTWEQMEPGRTPPYREFGKVAYDTDSDRVLLFGGSVDEETAEFDDTWAYDVDRDAWTQIETAGPTARAWHTMAADDETGLVVLFGGGVTRDDYTNEVWIFDPSTEMWSQAS
jgi:hypothetical protein